MTNDRERATIPEPPTGARAWIAPLAMCAAFTVAIAIVLLMEE